MFLTKSSAMQLFFFFNEFCLSPGHIWETLTLDVKKLYGTFIQPVIHEGIKCWSNDFRVFVFRNQFSKKSSWFSFSSLTFPSLTSFIQWCLPFSDNSHPTSFMPWLNIHGAPRGSPLYIPVTLGQQVAKLLFINYKHLPRQKRTPTQCACTRQAKIYSCM